MPKIQLTELPEASFLSCHKTSNSFSDSYRFTLNKRKSVEDVYSGIFGYLPGWVKLLMRIRNVLVIPFGIKGSQNIRMAPLPGEYQVGAKAGFLTLVHISEKEVVSSVSDGDMDIYISVMYQGQNTYRISSLVNLKNFKAKVYLSIIKPFHKRIVPFSIKYSMKNNYI